MKNHMVLATYENAVSLVQSLIKKERHYDGKSNRAKKIENYDTYRALFWRYYHAAYRASFLTSKLKLKQLRSLESIAMMQKINREAYIKTEARRIAEGKDKFENRHVFSPHFMRTSLTADYGTYTCDRCNREFYHSPSTIKKANKITFDCCCGYCTNEIIGNDWNSQPYE